MHFLKLVLRNTLRHKLRSGLTVLGLVVAILAFGLLHTVVDAWYAGAEGASSTRLVTRSSISLVFPLPINYQERIRGIEGINAVSHATWFGGVYITEKNFFPQFAVDERTYFDLYPEYLIPPAEMRAFRLDRKGCVIGRKLADTYGFRVGDTISLRGTIYPGTWGFTVRAIYDGAKAGTDTSQMFFHWNYLNETIKKGIGRRTDYVGVYVIEIADPDRAAEISNKVDAMFRNSLAETLTETEKAFQLGFVAMTEAIVIAIRIVSFVVIFIILAVTANTMAMTTRERIGEYATLKALGFGPRFLVALIYGESLAIAITGAIIGVLLTFPVADRFSRQVGTLFPVFGVSVETVYMQVAAAIAVGLVAAAFPAIRATRVSIVEGLRSIG